MNTFRRIWLPSLSLCLWLAFFLGLHLTDWRLVLISADGDPCWHWRTGNWMIERGEIMRTDPFSHTRAGAPLVAKEWLSQVMLAAAGNAFGWNGVVLAAALVIATTLWLLHRQLLSEGTEALLATALVLAAAWACSMHWLARPHLVTHLMVVLFAWQLRCFDRQRLGVKQLFARLVALMLLWANLHAAFFTGLVLIATYAAGNAVELLFCARQQRPQLRRKILILALLGIACAVVTLLNPAGWKLHEHIVSFLRTPYQAYFTNEWGPVDLHSAGMRGFVLQLFLLAVMLVAVRPRLRGTDFLLIGSWAYFALHSVRNVPVFALVVTPILAEHLNLFLQQARDSRLMRLYRRLSADLAPVHRAAGGQALVALSVLAILVALAKPRLAGGPPVIATDILTNKFPAAAVKFLQEQPQAVSGEMFNDYGWGGYLVLYLPERKVFIDGRNDFYGEALLREFSQAYYLKPGWEAVFEKYGVGWTLLPPAHPLSTLLGLRGDWALVYRDDVAAVYTKKRAGGP